MRKILSAGLIVFALASCTTQDKSHDIIGKWQAVDMDAPDVDRAMEDQMNFLDTMGDHTSPEQNMEIYGVADVTNLKDSLKDILMNFPKVQAEILRNSSIEFKSDSTFVSILNNNTELGKWHIDEAGKLIIRDESQQTEVNLISLTADTMRLEMERDGMASTVIFSRIDN